MLIFPASLVQELLNYNYIVHSVPSQNYAITHAYPPR